MSRDWTSTRLRLAVLTAIILSGWLGASWLRVGPNRAMASLVATRPHLPGDEARRPPLPLTTRCRHAAIEMQRQLGSEWRQVCRPPFVLVTNAGPIDLDHCYREIVLPFYQHWRRRFDGKSADKVLTVVMSRDLSSHLHATRSVAARSSPPSQLGYFDPTIRAALVNLDGGSNSERRDYRRRIRHELCHVMMSIDFAAAPAWLAEGMATLYEMPDPAGHVGPSLVEKVQHLRRTGRLEPIVQLVSRPTFATSRQALHYAHAGCLCEFLQHHRVLTPCYKTLRDATTVDSELPVAADFDNWRRLQRAFDRWLVSR